MKKLLLLSLLTSSYLFGIISIAPVEVGDKEKGLSGDILIALSSNRGNTETDVIDTGINLQVDMNNTLAFIKASYNYGEAKSITNIDKKFVHGRHIVKLNPHSDWESFAQLRSDAFQSLTSRFLLGGGTRLNGKVPYLTGKAYLGTGAFYVKEIESDLSAKEFGRANIYLSYKLAPNKNFLLTLISYYQPRLDNADDHLILSIIECDFTINAHFAFKVAFNYAVDSQPATGVSPYDFSQKTALKYSF